MNVDAQLAEALRDATHVFRPGESREYCRDCGRQRWYHLNDGHVTRPEHKYTIGDTKFRPGPHPYWTRPGSFNKKMKLHEPFPEVRARGIQAGTNSHPGAPGERPDGTVPFRDQEGNQTLTTPKIASSARATGEGSDSRGHQLEHHPSQRHF